MSDYISREAAIVDFERCNHENPVWTPQRVKTLLMRIPAADVELVRRSYWESYDTSQYMGTDEFGEPKWRPGRFYICHDRRCRRKTVVKSNYCPNCGTKMRAGDDDNEFVPLDEDEDGEDYGDV